MTYHSDPTRWTQSQGPQGADDGASELLRSAFRSGTREGPNDLQMHALTLKLAAVGAGAALSAGAVTAQASTTAAGAGSATTVGGAIGAVKSGSAFTLTKLALSVVLVGATATGTVVLQRSGALGPTSAPSHEAAQQAAHTDRAADAPATQPLASRAELAVSPAQLAVNPAQPRDNAPVLREQAPVTEELAPTATREAAAGVQPAASSDNPAALHAESGSSAEHRANRAARHRAAHASAAARSAAHAVAAARPVATTEPRAEAAPQRVTSSAAPSIQNVAAQRQQPSEIELLGKARSALAAHPRDAYRLAQEHKDLYPTGVFAQERDALAVEAAQRAGELKLARQLAESFVKRYPSSPHAHRFRETMNLQ